MYTVCIPTTGLAEKDLALTLTLESLLAQSSQPAEIIISVNGDREPRPMLSETKWTFIDASEQPANVSFARNLAATHASSETLLFLDDDTVLADAGVMQRVMGVVDEFEFGFGAVRKWTHGNWADMIKVSDPIWYKQIVLDHISVEPSNINRTTGSFALDNFTFLGNFGVASKRKFFEVGGYDESFRGWGYEDTDLMQSLFHAGAKFRSFLDLSLKCFHLTHPVSQDGLSSNMDLYRKKIKKRGQEYNISHVLGVFETGDLKFSYDR